MKGEMHILGTDGIKYSTQIDHPPTLEELRNKLGGGYLELVPLFTEWHGERCAAFCDEEGKLKSLPINVLATSAWYSSAGPDRRISDVLVGPIVVITGDEELLGGL